MPSSISSGAPYTQKPGHPTGLFYVKSNTRCLCPYSFGVVSTHKSLSQALSEWAAAWSAKDLAHYQGYYAKSFIPEGGRPIEQWANENQARLGKPGEIKIDIGEVKLSPPGADKTTTEFRQTYSRASYRDMVIKRMEWVREENRSVREGQIRPWKIQREQVLTTAETANP